MALLMPGPEQTETPQVDVGRLLLLRDIGRAFNSSLDLTQLFQMVLEKVMQVLAAEAASLWLIQDDKQLHCETAIGPVSEKVKGIRLPWGTGIVGWVSEHAKPVIVADAQKDKFLSHKVDSDTGFVTCSMICAPMVVRGKCLGAIQIVNKVRNDDLFSKSDLELLVDMAVDAAIAVENARLYQAESKVKELQALLKISREIASTLDLDRILKTVVNILSTVVTYERGSIALLDEGQLAVNAISGQQQVDRKDPATKGLEDFLRDQHSKNEAHWLVPYEDRTALILPMRDEEGLVGILALEAKPPQHLTPSQIEIVSILAAQATVAIRNAQLYKQVPTLNLQGIASILSPKAMNRRRLTVLGIMTAAIVALCFIQVPLTIPGEASVLPSDQIRVVAREGGTIKRVLVSEGDPVKEGALLAELDSADLELGLAAKLADLEVSRVKTRQLRLSSDAGALALEEIRVRQAEAEAALLRQRIAAARLLAPIAGVVVTPKLREKLGATLAKGEALLDLARVEEMTVDIAVGEGDLGRIKEGEPVSVRLLAYPTRTFRGEVALISPKAEPSDTGSTFKVRATIANEGAALRAGMQGTARIQAGHHRLVVTMLRGPAAWLQLTWWRLKP